MNFLDLCRAVARESGTVEAGQPSTVTGQTGWLARIVAWTADAWHEIQTERTDWLFMRSETEIGLTAGQTKYTPPPPDFGMWLPRTGFWLRDPSIGYSDEGPLTFVSWETWLVRWGRGSPPSGRPVEVAVAPDAKLCFGPVPDRGYRVRCEYLRRPQVLQNDADVPQGLPEELHPAIVWRALHKLASYDDAPSQVLAAMSRYRPYWERLLATQIPQPAPARPGGFAL